MNGADGDIRSVLIKHDDIMTELFAASIFLPVALCIQRVSDGFYERVKPDWPLDLGSVVMFVGDLAGLFIMIALCLGATLALGYSFQDALREAHDKFRLYSTLSAAAAFSFFILMVKCGNDHLSQAAFPLSLFVAGASLLFLEWREFDLSTEPLRSITTGALLIIPMFLCSYLERF